MSTPIGRLRTTLVTVCLAGLAGLVPLASSPAQAAYLGDALHLPPHADYQTTETDHFVVVYPRAYSVEAGQAEVFLEDAYNVLTKAFQYAPDHKCHIILTDNDDFANGVTSAIGHQGIVLYLTAPDPYSSIGEYDHWLRSLIIHEYAHYVTIGQARGLFELGRYVFGDLILPNSAWPAWISEGMAVYAESVYTKQGRGSGTYYATIARDGLARGRLGKPGFLEFDSLTGPIPDYPFGEGWYFAGFAMIDEMIRRHGEDAAARFAEASSWRFPFFNDGTLAEINRDSSAMTFEDLWADWIKREATAMGPELEWLKAHGSGDPRFLSPEGASAVGSRLSPDSTQVAFTQSSGHSRPGLFVGSVDGSKPRRLEDAIAGPGLAWSRDGRKLYYSKTDFDGPYSFYSDLYEYDVAGSGSRRLTHGARAKDPDLCATVSGDVLVYATQRGRFSQVRQLALPTGRDTLVYAAPADHHVANARCTPDGRSVLFSEHGTLPLDALMKVERPAAGAAPGQASRLFGGPEKYAALFPEPRPNGDIYFTRARDDYYELVRFDAATKQLRLVARSSGGYWLPSVGRRQDLMSVSYVSSTGIRVGTVNPVALESAMNAPETKAAKEPAPPPGLPHLPELAPPKLLATPSSGYNLFKSLAPRIWSPFFEVSTNDSQFGANILGWDDLDQLEYNVFVWYDTLPRKPEGIFATFHRVGTFRLNLAASSQISKYAVAGDGTREYDEERKLSVALSRPLPGAFENFTPSVLAEWARTFRDGDYGSHVFPPDERLGAELVYDNRARYAYSITAEKGVSASAAGRRFFAGSLHAWKGMVTLNPVVPLFPSHANLSVNGIFGVAPNPTNDITESFVRVGGQGTSSDLDPPLRGYPLGNFATSRAAIVQTEYRVPLSQVFKGYGTWPLFLQNLGAFGFYDAAKLQRASGGYTSLIDGVGGGLLLNSTVAFAIPLQIRLEFSHGFKQELNGQNIFSANVRF